MTNDPLPKSFINSCRPVWVTDHGQEIPLADMTTEHVANCISAIERGEIMRMWCSGYTTEQWLEMFKMELRGRNLGMMSRM